MRLWIFLLVVTGFLAACSANNVPADIIPGEKMGTIIWQLMQSDEYVNNILAKDSAKKNSAERMKIYQQVFDLNKTSLPEFKKSYQFYMAHPDITKVIFDSITVKAARQRAELYKAKPADTTAVAANMKRIQIEKHRTDSIAKANIRRNTKKNKFRVDSVTSPNPNRRFKIYKPMPDTAATHHKK